MAVLTPDELTALRRAAARDEHPDWDKPTINAALQSVEDVLEVQAFDGGTLVAQSTRTEARAQIVDAALNSNQIESNLVPVAEDWLADHPVSVTTRSVDTAAIAVFVTSNRPAYATAVAGMPANQREKLIQLVVKRRVEAAV